MPGSWRSWESRQRWRDCTTWRSRCGISTSARPGTGTCSGSARACASTSRTVVRATLQLSGSTQQLGLVEHQQGGGGFRPQNLGLDHLAFAVDTREELIRWADRFQQRAITNTGVVDTPFGAMLHFNDPDGIALALFWNR